MARSQFTSAELEATATAAFDLTQRSDTDAPALIAAWVKAENAAAVQSVAERAEGPVRKAARRGLSVLKSRGVALPASERTARVGAAEEPTRKAWILPPDGAGVQAAVLCAREPSGSYQSCFVFFRAGGSILRAQTGTSSLSKIKEGMRQALGGAGYSGVPVPFAWAQYRITERRGWHAQHGVVEPLGLLGSESLLGDAPTEAPPHPFDEEGLTLGTEDAEHLASESRTLHQMPEFRSWLPEEAAVQRLLQAVGNQLSPEDAGEQDRVEPIVRQEVRAATDRYFTPERRLLLAERMKDSALSVLARSGETAALRVAAVIQLIQSAGLITDPPSEVTFLSGFFDKALSLIAAQQGGRLRVPIPRKPTEAPDEEAQDAEEAGGESTDAETGAASVPEAPSEKAPEATT